MSHRGCDMKTWLELVHSNESELASNDIAEVNLACSVGLPGIVQFDLNRCKETLADMAERVRWKTQKYFRLFEESPRKYHYSRAYFRMLTLVTVLQRDCGIHYNPEKIAGDARFIANDSFLAGVLQSKAGTCANLPVLFIAVGRRLNYPLKLVAAKGDGATHLFLRWDDPRGECFNIEATDTGLRCPPDDYYRSGRYAISRDIETKGRFLKSMTAREELASFLAERSAYFSDAGAYRSAVAAMAWASVQSPENAFYSNTLKMILNEWLRKLQERRPCGFPAIVISPGRRRFPETFRFEMELDILGLETLENMLNDPDQNSRWWDPMRRGLFIQKKPKRAHAQFSAEGCTIHLSF